MKKADILTLYNHLKATLIPLNGKIPQVPDWQKLIESHPTASDIEATCNIGVVLGNNSSGLVDIDIDDIRALALADIFLPETGMEFGRKSKPRSHRIYRCQNAGKTKRFEGRNGVIAELRGNGGQTMFPPSIHPLGERVEFFQADEPAEADWNDLEAHIIQLGIATEISQFYRDGSRHDIAYALSGFLRRCNWPQERTEKFITKLAIGFSDNDIHDRVQAARDAYAAATPMGRRKLGDLTDDEFAASASKWLGYHANSAASQVAGLGSLDTEADCASEFVIEYGDRVIFDDVVGQFYLRRGGVYGPVSEDVIRGLVQDMPDTLASKFPASSLKKFKSSAGVRGILNLARPQFIRDARSFDTDHTLLGVQNGVLDLKSKTLLEHPSSIVTKRASVKFNPEADCPAFKAFLREIMGGDEELIAYVRRVLGYSITGYTGEQACFIAIGSGANGKSTLFSVVHKVLGDYAGDTPMQTLMQNKYGDQNTYDLAALEGKRLVIAQEGEANSKLAEAKLKAMTGGDPIACRAIYGKPKTYDPRFKIVLVTNELPKIDGVDEATWRRIKVIPFNVTIPRDKRDPYLKEKLLAEKEGILNFLIECFHEYEGARLDHQAGSGLFEPEVVFKEIENYRAEADSVGMFIRFNCVEAKGNSSSTRHLYHAYCGWCDESGIEPLSSSHFGRNLGRKGYAKYKMSAGNGWKGIALRYKDTNAVRNQVYSSTGQTYQLQDADFETIF